MAVIQYGEALGDGGQPSAFFSGSLSLTDTTPSIRDGHLPKGGFTKIEYTDKETGAHVIFEGRHLKLDGDGILAKGVVTEINFTAKKVTDSLLDFTDAHYNAAALYHAYKDPHHGGIDGLTSVALAGNDIITGSSHNDFMLALGGKDDLHGGKGDDYFYGAGGDATFTGDAGADVFYIAKNFGKETVTDFDAQSDLDLIAVGKGDFDMSFNRRAQEVTIDFHGGDVLVIEGMKHSIDPSSLWHFQS